MTPPGATHPALSSQHHQPMAHYDQNQKEVRTGGTRAASVGRYAASDPSDRKPRTR